jgi:hypothetical protein
MVSREIGDLLDALGDVEIDAGDFIMNDPTEVIEPEVNEAESKGDDDLDV